MDKEIKFAHLADLHLGGWREKNLHLLNFKTFQLAIKNIIEEKYDFCLFAGDIFNSPLPSLEIVEKVIKELIKLKTANIPLYVIGGSHDYSLSQKSFIDILDSAQILKNVGKYEYINKNEIELKLTKDQKTNTIISGILGKKNGLDKNIYKNLNKISLNSNELKIFLFHTTLNDIKPDFLKNLKTEVTSNYLPSGFNYYAGGHIHTHMTKELSKNVLLSYPGPLFPNNFSELKKETPSYNHCIFNQETKELKIDRKFLQTYKKEYFYIEIDKLTPIKAKQKIEESIFNKEIENKIILIELFGIIDGKISEIEINKIISEIYKKGALQVLKNSSKLTTINIEKTNINKNLSIKDLEETIINTYCEKNDIKNEEKQKIFSTFLLNLEKNEDEKNYQYEDRIKIALKKTLN